MPTAKCCIRWCVAVFLGQAPHRLVSTFNAPSIALVYCDSTASTVSQMLASQAVTSAFGTRLTLSVCLVVLVGRQSELEVHIALELVTQEGRGLNNNDDPALNTSKEPTATNHHKIIIFRDNFESVDVDLQDTSSNEAVGCWPLHILQMHSCHAARQLFLMSKAIPEL